MILMCMIEKKKKNETYALSTYLPEEYYSDVVEKEVTLQKLQDGAKADSDDKYLVADYSQLLNNIQNGQAPILTHTQYRQSYSMAKKIVLTERTMLYSYISDICMVH